MKAIYTVLILVVITSFGCSKATPPPSSLKPAASAPKRISGPSVSDFTGVYAIDLERSDKSTEHINIRSNIRLTINPDSSIVIGAGKIKKYELVSDFNDKGIARFIERTVIEGTVYEKGCEMQYHSDGHVEVAGDYFKLNEIYGYSSNDGEVVLLHEGKPVKDLPAPNKADREYVRELSETIKANVITFIGQDKRVLRFEAARPCGRILLLDISERGVDDGNVHLVYDFKRNIVIGHFTWYMQG